MLSSYQAGPFLYRKILSGPMCFLLDHWRPETGRLTIFFPFVLSVQAGKKTCLSSALMVNEGLFERNKSK
jgi:hypothetical protein